uniref:Uncharacterized protein n=1 Tax=viral metagenome TaxID=1070528 RepID=A0A6C0CUV7_9ZZZZ
MSDDNMEIAAENIPTLSDNINENVINPSNNTQATIQIQHIYQITDTDILKNIVKGNVDNELGDGDHDLVRKGEETNPLIMYCEKNKEGKSYINGIFVDFSFSYQGYNRSQTKIVEEMEKNIKSNTVTHKNRTITHFERTIVNIEKYMINLQEYLSSSQEDIHTTGPISNTIVETHRGQEWDNRVFLAKMYKAQLTTTFDNPGQPDIGIGGIYNNVSELNAYKNELIQRFKTSQKYDLPLLRFYPNYLPNAFSIFIRKNEATKIVDIITPYFQNKIPPVDIPNEAEKIKTFLNRLNRVGENDLLLLHMFSNGTTTSYSIQYGPIIANEVTYQLYGYPKRGCIRTNFGNPNMVFEHGIDPFMKNCHILWGKTCGDGVSIEAANMLSYITGETVNVLSIDECCNLRASFITGLSTCQKQSTFAGTGLGFLSTHRNVEFFKSTNIGKPVEEIYKDKILKITNPHDYYEQQLQKLFDLIKNENSQEKTIIDEFVNKFIEKKNAVLLPLFSDFKNFINNNGLKQDGSFDSDTFYDLGKFNIQNYIAEIDEYSSSFTKLLNDFNTRFENIFMYNPRKTPDNNEFIVRNIELGVRFMSSIEEKLIECGMTGGDLDDQRKQIVFTFLSTLMTSIGEQKVKIYCVHLYNNILGLFNDYFNDYFNNIPITIDNSIVSIDNNKYKELLELYDNIAGIGPEDTIRYKNKCIIKENINLLKFILRHQEFMMNPESPYNITNDKKLINLKMNTNTKYSVLGNKLRIYKTFYEQTRQKFESPTKTAEKRKKNREDSNNSSTGTSPTKVARGINDDIDKEEEKGELDGQVVDLFGFTGIQQVTPRVGFNEDIFDEDNFNNVFRGVEDCDDTENNLVSVGQCNEMNNCDDPDNLLLGVTNFISNISTLCYTAFSNIFSFTSTTVTDSNEERLEQFEKNLEGIQNLMNENVKSQNKLKLNELNVMTLRSGTTVESPIYQEKMDRLEQEMDILEQQMAELKRQAEDIEVEINQIIGIQQQPQESATSSSLSNANVTPEKVGSYFSFLSGKKGGKKSPKKQVMTRRKNKKTFKRKTMKKRKIPKRKNKTRRLRQCK